VPACVRSKRSPRTCWSVCAHAASTVRVPAVPGTVTVLSATSSHRCPLHFAPPRVVELLSSFTSTMYRTPDKDAPENLVLRLKRGDQRHNSPQI
jgi:hypothetical protein